MDIETSVKPIVPSIEATGASAPELRWLRQFEIDEIATKLLDATENDVFVSPKDGFDKAVRPTLSEYNLIIPDIDTFVNLEGSPESGEFDLIVGHSSDTADVHFYFAYYREADQLYRVHADVMGATDFERFQWGLDSADYDAYFEDEPELVATETSAEPKLITPYKDIKVDDKIDPLDPDLPHADDDYMIIHPIVTSKDLEEQQ